MRFTCRRGVLALSLVLPWFLSSCASPLGLTVDPETLDFGEIPPGADVVRSVRLLNHGPALEGISLVVQPAEGAFQLLSPALLELGQDGGVVAQLVARAERPGLVTGVLTIVWEGGSEEVTLEATVSAGGIDGDRDGSPYGVDCDDGDAAAFPGAPETCNGADDDCDGAVPPDEVDADEDGARLCSGDCDDSDATRSPLLPEVCDGVDNDCADGVPSDEVDGDSDGFMVCGEDCNDADPLVHPDANELCNGLDDDCDGALGLSELDGDGDGLSACDGDCNNADPTVFPGAIEVCDAQDNDCDGDLPEEEADLDADGSPQCAGDCDDGAPEVFPGAPELCDGLDNDCASGIPGDELDLDGDGARICAGDCLDTNAAVLPGASEVCDGFDTDCSSGGSAPDDPNEQDGDADGWVACGPYVDNGAPLAGGGDCADADGSRYPFALELCNGVDDSCAGALPVDESDGDGDGLMGCAGDCDDGSAAVLPGAPELCDGLDNDCVGGVPADEVDGDADSVRICGGDCLDTNGAVNPGATEVCDGFDTDCGSGSAVAVDAAELDGDGDGWLPCTGFVNNGAGPMGGGDCADGAGSRYPGAPELCNGVDDDCDGGLPSDEADADGDGVTTCGGDCEDAAGTVFPGASELCDGLDNDCSAGVPTNEADVDGDGVRICGGDCLDANGAVFPGAIEVCDGFDTDCSSGSAVGADPSELDGDNDGYASCGGFVNNGSGLLGGADCADSVPSRYPGATELCNGIDDSCDGALPADELDGDGDGMRGCAGDCDDGDATVLVGAAELCDGLDNDCLGGVPANEADADNDAVRICGGDCLDSNGAVQPGAVEACDGFDTDCSSGASAPDAAGELDADNDGWAACTSFVNNGSGLLGGGDCADAAPLRYPAAPETCDLLDDDCDGLLPLDEQDVDTDGWATCEGDCDDGAITVSPSATEDPCNGVDDNCDTAVDEGAGVHGFLKFEDSASASLYPWSESFQDFGSPTFFNPSGDGDVEGGAVADFNGDGLLDLMVERIAFWPTTVPVHSYVGVCNGTFTQPATTGLTLSLLGADLHGAADVDGDNDVDLIAWDWGSGGGWVFLNDGTGLNWSRLPSQYLGTRPFSLTLWNASSSTGRESVQRPFVDVTGDGVIDIVECGNSQSAPTTCYVHAGVGNGTFTNQSRSFSLQRVVNGFAFMDVNGDGALDFVGGLDDDSDAGQVYVWTGPFGGSLWPSGAGVALFDVNPDLGSADADQPGYGWLYPYDWDGDGVDDLLLSIMDPYNTTDRAVYLALNDGSGSFTVSLIDGDLDSAYNSNFVQDPLMVPVWP